MTTSPPLRRHEGTRQVSPRWLLLALVLPIIVFTQASPARASGILPGANPASNATPTPNFLASGACSLAAGSWHCSNPCVTARLTFPAYANRPACQSYVLLALNGARASEHLRAIALPSNWYSLTTREQLFVLADLERTARGLPPYLGLNPALSAEAQHAATSEEDPGLAPGFAVGRDAQGYDGMGGAWSSGFTALGADFFWMYADGWGGSAASTENGACTSPASPGCWAHRDQLLGFDPHYNPGVGLRCADCEMGTGYSLVNGASSYVDLVELPEHGPPSMTFTWARNVVPFLRTAHVYTLRAAVRRHELARHLAAHGLWLAWLTKPATANCTVPSGVTPWGPPWCRHETFKRAGISP